jgi:hypothetical protein
VPTIAHPDNEAIGLSSPRSSNLLYAQHLYRRASLSTISSPAAPQKTVTMTAPTTNAFSEPVNKQDTVKQWLQRRLRKLPSIQPANERDGGLRERPTIKRPGTAPSTGRAEAPSKVPPIPPIPISIPRQTHNASLSLPVRPARPDLGVTRDINAWLDTSITPSPPLMGGIPYWKKAIEPNFKDGAGIQHATPIGWESEGIRPSTSQSQRMKPFRRRAKKIQVQMPLLVRNKSLRNAGRNQVNRRSNSMPVFAIAYDSTQQATLPIPVPVLPLRAAPAIAPAIPVDEMHDEGILPGQPRFRYGSPASGRSSTAEGNRERRMGMVSIRSVGSADSTRPSTTAAPGIREDSTGDFSDVPAYSSGLHPPSYRSRPASILTTSSFGCIDGMNPAQRQISQQRAAMQRGVKGKLRRFAQNFST